MIVVVGTGGVAAFRFVILEQGIVASIITLSTSVVLLFAFRCYAEHLRLLNEIARCEFDSTISGAREEVIDS